MSVVSDTSSSARNARSQVRRHPVGLISCSFHLIMQHIFEWSTHMQHLVCMHPNQGHNFHTTLNSCHALHLLPVCLAASLTVSSTLPHRCLASNIYRALLSPHITPVLLKPSSYCICTASAFPWPFLMSDRTMMSLPCFLPPNLLLAS